MKKESKIIITILILIIIALCIVIYKKSNTSSAPEEVVKEEVKYKPTPITITEQNIKEDNFTGTRSVIKGSSLLASTAEKYIDQTVDLFKQSADEEVPGMKKAFGEDSPTANYEIDIKAKHAISDKTESIIIQEYVYTGGANGNNLYKVFTASLDTGKILSLSDIILPSKQAEFTSFLKKKLTDWRPEGGEASEVFPDAIKELTFASFDDWSFSKDNLIIYFDKYEIGPGALGVIAFPIPLSKIQSFLVK